MNKYSAQYFRLTFNEANILMENITGFNKTNLIIRLQELAKTAADDVLGGEATSLLLKLIGLSEGEFGALQNAAREGRVIHPPNFTICN